MEVVIGYRLTVALVGTHPEQGGLPVLGTEMFCHLKKCLTP